MPKRPILPVEDLSADTQKFFDVLNQSSDLGVVLVTASYLDASIGSLLHRFFQASAVSDKLLDIQGVLGTRAALDTWSRGRSTAALDDRDDLR